MRWLRSLMTRLMGLPSCEEIVAFSYAYLEGDLDPEVTAKFERHLGNCRNCLRFVESYRQIAKPKRLTHIIPIDPDFELRATEFLKQEASRS